MKNVSKYKVEKGIIIPLIIMTIISISTIFCAQSLLSNVGNLALRQLIWFISGFGIAYALMAVGNKFLYRNIWFLYGIGILLLVLLLFFAPTINSAKCWFVLPGIGTFQPSEFMKIILIITLGMFINEFNEKNPNPTLKDEFKFLLKVGVIVGIPSILTFLQPDTGVVLIYILITMVMLFVSGIRARWFLILIGILLLAVGVVLGVYFASQDLFIKTFGTSFFLRVDRLLDWGTQSGYQLENAMMAIGSGGLFGHGFNNTPVYFPEPQTDFIFAVFASNYGLIGTVSFIGLLIFFDTKLISLAIKSSNNTNKYVIAGIIGMLLYQQVQNIGMTIGLLPITGITLPFISYGGSSLLSYMIMAGIIFNISNESLRFTN